MYQKQFKIQHQVSCTIQTSYLVPLLASAEAPNMQQLVSMVGVLDEDPLLQKRRYRTPLPRQRENEKWICIFSNCLEIFHFDFYIYNTKKGISVDYLRQKKSSYWLWKIIIIDSTDLSKTPIWKPITSQRSPSIDYKLSWCLTQIGRFKNLFFFVMTDVKYYQIRGISTNKSSYFVLNT